MQARVALLSEELQMQLNIMQFAVNSPGSENDEEDHS